MIKRKAANEGTLLEMVVVDVMGALLRTKKRDVF
jgi:hypothetical protein